MRTFDDALEDHRIHCLVLQCLGEPLDGHKGQPAAQRRHWQTLGKHAAQFAVTAAVSALAGGAFIEVADNQFITVRVGGSPHVAEPHTRVRSPGAPRIADRKMEASAAPAALI